jgi:hypothetical protein
MLLRRIFRPKRSDNIRGWRKLHIEELHNLYSSPSIIIIIKSRRMRWTENVACMGRRLMDVGFCGKARRKIILKA